MKERHSALLEYVTQHGRTEVKTLAEYLHTSAVTIRKDLEYPRYMEFVMMVILRFVLASSSANRAQVEPDSMISVSPS